MQYAMTTEMPARGFKRSASLLPPGNSFVRLITAKAVAKVTGEQPSDVALRMWPSDRVMSEITATDLVQRAATAPAMTNVTGWAAELVHKVVADGLAAMGGASAAIEILRRGLVLTFNGAGQISAPGFVASATAASFVAEGDPIPVRQLANAAVLLEHTQIATIAVLTREMVESSNAEAIIGDVLSRSAGLALDSILLDATVSNAARPAGLRYNIATTTASNNADPLYAFGEDIVALINAVAPVGGNGPYIIVANPGRAAAMQLKFINQISSVVVLGSSALTTELICIAPGALVAAFSPEPNIETSKSASLHMDTAPVAVGSAGPHKSMFQTDSLALKVRWPVSWMLRDARGVAWTTPTWK